MLIQALISIAVGIAEKLVPSFVKMWADRAADKKLAAERNKIADAIKEANK